MHNCIKNIVAVVILAGTGLSCSLFESGRSDIVWHDEDLQDYVIYAFSPGTASIAIIEVATGKVHKPLPALGSIWSVVTNEEGTRLFVSTGEGHAGTQPGAIYMIDTKTWQYEIIYERAAHLLTDRAGGIFFITKGNDPETGFAIFDRLFGEIERPGTIKEHGWIQVAWLGYKDCNLIEIHPHEPLVYAVNRAGGNLYRYNYATGEVTSLFPDLRSPPISNITLSGAGDTLYIPGGPVIDLVNEKEIGLIPVWRLGSAAARRDNNEVYITDPGGYLRGPRSSEKVFVYSPNENRLIGEINVSGVDGRGVTDLIFLTPKERYAVASDWGTAYYVIDLKRREVVFHKRYTGDVLKTQGSFLARIPRG